MTTNPLSAGNEADAVPVACTLGSADMAAQASRWDLLIARAMTGRTETTDGIRLCFRDGPGIQDEVRQLVEVERECCPWASWTVRKDGREVVLDVRSTEAGLATLYTMFTLPEPGARN